jgi:Tol biopolymer transport system component
MTGHDDLDRVLAGWFEADAASAIPGGGLDRVRDAIRLRRPRPAWLASVGSDWVPAPSARGTTPGPGSLLRPRGLRRATVLVLLVALATLLGGAIFLGAGFLPRHVPAVRLGQLAYGLEGDIYIADWDGGNPVRIADGQPITGPDSCAGFWGEGAIWAPDGGHLAYRSYWSDVCHGVVFIADPEGHTVASFAAGGWLISWSADSTRVATWAGDGIGIFGIDGTREASLTVSPGFMAPGDFDPVWSRDGTSLVVPFGGLVPIDGSTPTHLPAGDPQSQRDAAYSPDGGRAAYLTSPGAFLTVSAADGSAARQVSGDQVGSFVWSPRGDRIAYVANAPTDPRTGGAQELRLLDLASGAVTTLARADAGDSLRVIRFSPVGDRILFAVTDRHESLWAVRSDGSDKQLLVPGSDWGDWQWSSGSE